MTKTSIHAEPGKQEIVITRIFDAPRELVYEIFTDPASISEWWGPRNLTTIVDRMEVRKGGVWRYVHRDSSGAEYGHHGVYHECIPPERIVNTYEFEGAPGSVGLVTVTFEELSGGRTRFTETSLFPSVEVRDGVLQSGMSEGAIELMDRLAELLANRQGN